MGGSAAEEIGLGAEASGFGSNGFTCSLEFR